MKDLKNLLVRVIQEQNTDPKDTRLTDLVTWADRNRKSIYLKDEFDQGITEYKYKCVLLRRSNGRVIATILPANLVPVKENHSLIKQSYQSYDVVATEGEYSPKVNVCRIRDKFVNRFISVRNGGFYGGPYLDYKTEYVGVFTWLDTMYSAIKHIYHDL